MGFEVQLFLRFADGDGGVNGGGDGVVMSMVW